MRYICLLILAMFMFSCNASKKIQIEKVAFVEKTTTKVVEVPQPTTSNDEVSVESSNNDEVSLESSEEDVPPPDREIVASSSRDEEAETIFISTNTKVHLENTRKIETKIKKSEEFDKGILVYKIPDTMVIYTNYDIIIRISRDKKHIDITNGLGDKVISKIIKTTEEMDVSLVDESPDSSFIIKKINTETQLVDSDGYTQWIYSVRPIKHGEKKLLLVVSIIKGNNKKQIVYSDTIHVKENIGKEVTTFWGKYWQWLFTTFLIPIFVYFWKRKNKEKD